MHRSLAAASILALAACAPRARVVTDGGLAVRVARAEIRVANRTSEPVFTFFAGREALMRIRWAPCVDPARCVPLAPGATRIERHPTIPGGAREREAVLYWWHAVPGPNGAQQPDSVRSIVVPLR